jgi:DUF438 domain-containing protein
MSEIIDNSAAKKETLKHLILELHKGNDPETVRAKVMEIMGDVPYAMIVEAEQELIQGGLPHEEVLNLCDMHAAVLEGSISHEGMKVPESGHPVHTFLEENRALEAHIAAIMPMLEELASNQDRSPQPDVMMRIRSAFNTLMDVDKHYRRKENLLFPFLEKYGITGPPTVMWGKHDQVRKQMKAALEMLSHKGELTSDEIVTVNELVLKPVLKGIKDMISKEEQILFPMCMDRLTDEEWYQIMVQSPEIGFCLYDPKDEWRPSGTMTGGERIIDGNRVQLPSGSFLPKELIWMLNTLPVDLTFVDKDDTVRYFTQGKERIFDRNRTILGRKVQLCHPPQSVHVVNQILDDFRSGRQDSAAFWINMGGKFIHIEYFAVRDDKGGYLGTVEVSQNLTELRALQGERRLLTYESKGTNNG